jgi:hypothetical protein
LSSEDIREVSYTLIILAVLSGIVAVLVVLTTLFGERRADVVMFGAWFILMLWIVWKGWKELAK